MNKINRSRILSRALWQRSRILKPVDALRSSVYPCVEVINARNQSSVAIEDSYVKKFMKAVGWMDQSRTRLKLSGYFLYECIPEQVNYVEWFSICHLEDTFNSWFNITELHVWILMVRCMAEDAQTHKEKNDKDEGHFIRNCIVEAMWADVANRIKFLEGANPAIARKQVSELSEQFQAALVAYDEGLEDDRTLAGAVWRRFFALSPETDPQDVERIVKFIRHQISLLDKLSSDQLRKSPNIEWLSVRQ